MVFEIHHVPALIERRDVGLSFTDTFGVMEIVGLLHGLELTAVVEGRVDHAARSERRIEPRFSSLFCGAFTLLVGGISFSGSTHLSLIHISEPTRQAEISYAVFCL